jgi:predicted HTH domain antitoxin
MLVIEDEFVKASKMSEPELLLELAVVLFQKAKLSSHRAARLAKVSWDDFMKELYKRKISLFDEETMLDELK